MITKGASIHGRNLADHLLKPENERVEVLEMSGVCADNLHDAINVFDAFAQGTKCKKPIYHGKLNPSINDRSLTREELETALSIFEENLGLTGQPRIIVLHEKQGREHYHLIYSRINLDTMTAIPDSWNFLKHEKASREIEQALALEQTRSCLYQRNEPRPERTPAPEDMQQAKRHGRDARAIKDEIRAIYDSAENAAAFVQGLESAGYTLAQGDSRDFVVVDAQGGTYSAARYTGTKAAAFREYMADIDRESLPSADELKEQRKEERRRLEAAHKRREMEDEEAHQREESRGSDIPQPDALRAFKAAYKRTLAEGRAAPAPGLAPGAEGQAAAIGYLAALAEAQNERAAQEPRPMHPDDHAAAIQSGEDAPPQTTRAAPMLKLFNRFLPHRDEKQEETAEVQGEPEQMPAQEEAPETQKEPEQMPAPVLDTHGASFEALDPEQVRYPEKHAFRALERRRLDRTAATREGFRKARDETTDRAHSSAEDDQSQAKEGGSRAPANDNTPTTQATTGELVGEYLRLCKDPLRDLRGWLDEDRRERGDSDLLPSEPRASMGADDELRPVRAESRDAAATVAPEERPHDAPEKAKETEQERKAREEEAARAERMAQFRRMREEGEQRQQQPQGQSQSMKQ